MTGIMSSAQVKMYELNQARRKIVVASTTTTNTRKGKYSHSSSRAHVAMVNGSGKGLRSRFLGRAVCKTPPIPAAYAGQRAGQAKSRSRQGRRDSRATAPWH